MLVSSIYDQIKEVTGLCSEAVNFQAMSRAVELLSNEGLFDPQIGYVEFNNSETNFVVLPRECKTVLRLNIGGQPTFFRNRLFEFTLNTNGSSEGDEPGLSWADRGYAAIQDERKLPGPISYAYESIGDLGKTITIFGKDEIGMAISETLQAVNPSAPSYGNKVFHAVDRIVREPTIGTCLLYCQTNSTTTNLIAQYAADEIEPKYRVIKLSKVVSHVRMMFRRDVYEITTMDSFIPVDSKMAMIHATKAVRLFAKDNYEGAALAMTAAIEFLKKEQESRNESENMAAALEMPTAIDASIVCRDSIIVADIYDDASEIFGPIGRRKVFDKITTAMEVLRNKAHWDASTGVVDIWMPNRGEDFTQPTTAKGTGIFVLPRFVESVISLNLCGQPQFARNRWFEFHVNGSGESSRSGGAHWDDAGETCIIQPLLTDRITHRVIPVKIVAVPDSEGDNGKLIRAYGTELTTAGEEIEVWRGGMPGWTVPCVKDSLDPGADAPAFTSITRITRDATEGFVRLYVAAGAPLGRLLGLYYPDELEPLYRAIKVSTSKAQRIRVLYRKRTLKISSLYEPIPLRSRLAITNMLRSLKVQESDPAMAMGFEEIAVKYLSEERINSVPSDVPVLEFNSGVMPGFTGNIT